MSSFSVISSGVIDAIMCDVAVIASDAPSTQEFCKCKALWDTGAVFSVISRHLATQLGLMPIDKGFAYTVQGTYEPSVYLLDVMLPNGMVVKNLHVTREDELLHLSNGEIAMVCCQWGSDNIGKFINGVRALGFKIEVEK